MSSAQLLGRHSPKDCRGGPRAKVEVESGADDGQKERSPEQRPAPSPGPGPLLEERLPILRADLRRKSGELLQDGAQVLKLTGQVAVLVKRVGKPLCLLLLCVVRRWLGRWARMKLGGQLSRAAQQHDVERGKRDAKERRALLTAGVGDKAQSQRPRASRADRIERAAKASRLLVSLGLRAHRRHLGDRQFLEPQPALLTLGQMHRIVAPLAIALFSLRAQAVETVRIAMEPTSASVDVSADALTVGRDDEEADFTPLDSARARVRAVDDGLEINGKPWEEDAVRFRRSPPDSDGSIRVGAFKVRGDLVVRLRSSGLQLINVLPLEEYLLGVVGAEMPVTFPLEALKAQAVAARTYALKKKLDASDPAVHLGAGVLSQVYRGLSRTDEQIRRAVEATRGEVLTSDLEPIEAYFHASCGGKTESGEAALTRELPYLQPVECPCGKLSTTRWELSVSAQELRNLFGATEPSQMKISARSATGRVRMLSLGRGHVVDAVEFRRKLGYERVKSLWFDLDRQSGDSIRIVGKGFGHGAGLCQRGAKAYAEQGWGYREILLHYYPGVEIQQLY